MAQPYDLPLEQLKVYRPEQTRKADFDAYWQSALAELKEVPLYREMTPHPYPVKGVRLYRLIYTGYGSAPIDGWLAIPDKPGPHPGLVYFHGYNWAAEGNVDETVIWALRGYATLHMFCRGQHGASMDTTVSSHGHSTGWMTKNILDADNYYYKAVYMDAVRALEVLASVPEVDPNKIGVTGGSQGGALSLAAAALSPIPQVAVADYPYLSHFERAIDITPEGPYLELNEFFRRNTGAHIEEQAKATLSYVDLINHAPNIRCHTWITVGLVDTITPPSTIFAVYNHLNCPKELGIFRYHGHEYIPGSSVPKLRVLMERLQK